MQGDDDAIKQLLLSLGVLEQSLDDIHIIIRLLHTIMVEEWDQNLDLYQGSVTEDLATVSNTYLQEWCICW